MDFQSFYQLYKNDMKQRLRDNTLNTKNYIVEMKILPFFGRKRMCDITAADVRQWQNKLKSGYASTYPDDLSSDLFFKITRA